LLEGSVRGTEQRFDRVWRSVLARGITQEVEDAGERRAAGWTAGSSDAPATVIDRQRRDRPGLTRGEILGAQGAAVLGHGGGDASSGFARVELVCAISCDALQRFREIGLDEQARRLLVAGARL